MLAPRKISTNALPITLENALSQASWIAYMDVRRTLWLGGGVVRLNLPEFIWLVSCFIVIDHYSFQCLKATFLSYLFTCGRGRRTTVAMETFNLQIFSNMHVYY